MAGDVRFLGDATPVLVLGDAEPRYTTSDGGRTTEPVEQVSVIAFRRDGTAEQVDVEPAGLYEFRPTIHPETQAPILDEEGKPAPPDHEAVTAIVGERPAHPDAFSSRGAAQTAEEQDATIAATNIRTGSAGDAARHTGQFDQATDEQLQAEIDRRRTEATQGQGNTTEPGPEATGPPL